MNQLILTQLISIVFMVTFYLPACFTHMSDEHIPLPNPTQSGNKRKACDKSSLTRNPEAIQLAIDFSVREDFEQVVIFDHGADPGCVTLGVRQVISCAGQAGKLTSIHSFSTPKLNRILKIRRHFMGIIIFLDDSEMILNEFIELLQTTYSDFFDEHYTWLLILLNPQNEQYFKRSAFIDTKLRYTPMALHSNVIVAARTSELYESSRKKGNRDISYGRENNLCPVLFAQDGINIQQENKSEVDTGPEKTTSSPNASIVVLQQDDIKKREISSPLQLGYSENFEENTNDTLNESVKYDVDYLTERQSGEYGIIQIFKYRPDNNDSLEVLPLGFWSLKYGLRKVLRIAVMKQRLNLKGYPFAVGIMNHSYATAVYDADPDAVKEENYGNQEDLNEILEYVSIFLNGTLEKKSFVKLGYKNHEGSWTDMLGAVTEGSIDLAIEHVIMTYERLKDMYFTHPLLESMRNIYLNPPETNTLRDIFVVPFSPILFVGVFTTSLLIALIAHLIHKMSMILLFKTIVANNEKFLPKERVCSLNTQVENDKNKYRSAVMDFIIWIIGILCMQGSVWKPLNLSGKIVIILSLLFALIIYNSYAASMTSVLSVQSTGIKSLEEVLDSGFDIGYIKNGQDEAYLRNVNDTRLREIFLRGFLKNSVTDAAPGLINASQGNYAFFLTSHIARRALQTLNPYSCRCKLKEIPIKSTATPLAFPLPRHSSYRKLINLSMIRLRETAVLQRIRDQMLPAMPRCENPTFFISAKFSDVYSAFVFMLFAHFLSLSIWLLECLWHKRAFVFKYMKEILIYFFTKSRESFTQEESEDESKKRKNISPEDYWTG